MPCETIIPHIKSIFFYKNFIFEFFIFFFENFVSFYLILFYLKIFFLKIFVLNSVHEQCPKSDSEIVLSPKTGWVHQVHSLLAKQHTQARTGTPRCSQWLCRGSPAGCVATPGCRVALPRALAPNAPLRRAPNLMLKWAVAYFNVYTIFIFFFTSISSLPCYFYIQ